MDLQLRGKRVLVTGGGKGAASATALALAREGAEVAPTREQRVSSRCPTADRSTFRLVASATPPTLVVNFTSQVVH